MMRERERAMWRDTSESATPPAPFYYSRRTRRATYQSIAKLTHRDHIVALGIVYKVLLDGLTSLRLVVVVHEGTIDASVQVKVGFELEGRLEKPRRSGVHEAAFCARATHG